jgi:hypothetical protein
MIAQRSTNQGLRQAVHSAIIGELIYFLFT